MNREIESWGNHGKLILDQACRSKVQHLLVVPNTQLVSLTETVVSALEEPALVCLLLLGECCLSRRERARQV